ncbi:hypothetical protein CLV35_2635 [Motilibacter peucedani]|uniref:DUF4259 domain-containing protein n=1 Tax=Motilibacter peucedani TaxID=598650 RepID=A0A420XPL1_9ACTN|nr:hypothetical protein [Motilibacter peucedani]RKS74133.1 hypothetical protein CLV35_2635 [Motilibacter peucedani]
MGAWGPAIFSDDVATDVRDDYKALLEDQVPDDEATQRVVARYKSLDADEAHVLWLALAATQSQLGRLDEHVKVRALEVIDQGIGLQEWREAGSKELAARVSALTKLRRQLTGPPPPRRTVRRSWRYETDLAPGDVLSFTASNGRVALLYVARIDDSRDGAIPILARLDWTGSALPDDGTISTLPTRTQTVTTLLGDEVRPDSCLTYLARRRDPDWQDTGFSRAGDRTLRGSTDEAIRFSTGSTWSQLATRLERELTRPQQR